MIKKENNFAYIDGANLHKGVAGLGWTLDYKRFRVWLSEKYGVHTAYLFIGLIPKYKELYKSLQESGFTLIFKEVIYDGDGKPKGNCDADLVLNVVRDTYENKLLTKYVYLIIKSQQKKVYNLQTGAGQPHVYAKDLVKLEIPVPHLPIQHKIVSILERAEKLKNLRQEANGDTNTIIQALFYEMFGDPVKNEKSYNVKPLVEICHRITDGTHVTPKYTGTGIPFLRVTDVTNSNESKKFISEEEHKEL